MRNVIYNLFTPPKFEGDDEKTRIAGLLNSILLFVVIATSLVLPALASTTDAVNLVPLFLLVLPFIVINIAAFVFLRRGNVLLAAYVFLGASGIGIFGSYAISDQQSVGALLSLTILISFTALLLDARAIIRLLAFIIVLTLIVTIFQTRGWITPLFVADTNPISNWLSNSFIFVLSGLGLVLSSISLGRALDSSRTSRASLETANRDLEELRKELEQRVSDRTADLERRAAQLQTVSSVARTIASIQELDTLLPDITDLVSEQFGFYHVGIFLVDEAKKFAVLRAANSAGGKVMLERQHQLRLDTNSIVGFATSRAEPRVALDVGTDAVYFYNPDLPETRSEMALPLQIGGRVIGALDVQSNQTNAFTSEDIRVLAILADQVAIAIENARLFSEAQLALSESQETFDKYVRQEWSSFSRHTKQSGFVFDGKKVYPMSQAARRNEVGIDAQTGILLLDKASSTLSVPIKLRGQTIGVLDVRAKSGPRKWTQAEFALLEAAAERAALALENARLLESAQRRAARERAIGEISSKIGSASAADSILQAAVEELGRKIGAAAEVFIELEGNEH